MKIALINPPTILNLKNVGTMKPSPPIGLAYVAAAARRAGHEVTIVDAIAMQPHETERSGALFRVGAGPADIVAAIPADTEAIGLGGMFSFLWPMLRELTRAIKERFPEVPLIAGGEHFTALPERSFAESPIDFIVVGEGEETFVALLEALASGDRRFDRVAGLVFRRGGGLHTTPRRERTRAVDEIPWPAWDLVDIDTYNRKQFGLGLRLGTASMPMLATRGCPYQCTFCTSPNMWTTRWYARNPTDVADEIESYYRRYGATSFPFHDLTAVIKRQWMVDFCTEMIRRNLPVQWQLPVGTRCEAFDAEVAGLMVRSGCHNLAFAPETGSERIRERLKKRYKRDSLLEAVRVAVPAGLHVTCFFMIGLPFDTPEDYRATEELVRELARQGVEDISCHYYYPAPGTQIYRDLEASGHLRKDDAELMSALLFTDWVQQPQNCYNQTMTPLEIAGWRYRIFTAFYGTRFVTHPDAALRLVANVARGRETNKLEAFAREVVQRVRLRGGGPPARPA